MAFSFFENEQIDIAVIEVGLGGRLDSTNIITPEVSLITNIGFDHTDMLGDTLAKIALEKAGIIKKNVPVVISEFNEETAPIFKLKAKTLEADILFAEDITFPDYEIGLLGSYQRKNVKGVLAVIRVLKELNISQQHIIQGLKNVVENTGLMGRWQYIGSNPTIICDTAHNKEGLTDVLNQLKEQKYIKLHFVIGFVKGKDIDSLLPLFPLHADYYFCKPKISRGLDEKILYETFVQYGFKGKAYSSVNKALKEAKKRAGSSDIIYVGGSNFVVAEVL